MWITMGFNRMILLLIEEATSWIRVFELSTASGWRAVKFSFHKQVTGVSAGDQVNISAVEVVSGLGSPLKRPLL